MLRRQANIIITGTPGTGKTSHAQLLQEQLPELKVVDVKSVAKENGCITGYDDERKCDIIDEDLLVDALEDDLDRGNQVIDWHVCDVFPERVIDLVVVLRTENSVLYDRLKERKYPEKKISENIDAEIMEVILNDAREQYDENVIVELDSNKVEDVQANVDRIVGWLKAWRDDNPDGIQNFAMPSDSDSDSD